jgi:hypothetical protein
LANEVGDSLTVSVEERWAFVRDVRNEEFASAKASLTQALLQFPSCGSRERASCAFFFLAKSFTYQPQGACG